jgi:prepilin-type processing-associated H-X9-DG protein
MRSQFACLSLALAVLAPAAVPQPAAIAPAAPAEPGMVEEMDPMAMMRQMGAGDEEIMMLQLLSQAAGMDLGQAMMLFMLADQGNIDDDVVGMLLLSKAFAGGGAKQPTALLAGDSLLVVEDGVVYRIDIAKMEVTGSVTYRASAQKAGVPGELMPVLKQAREKAQLASCTSNMKQLCLAALMYAQDWDETLPNENWPKDLEPYIGNTTLFRCPAAPERIGYALNAALAAGKMGDVKNPAETVFFFEADVPDDVAFGGPEAVLQEPRHADRIVVGFVDGHARAMEPAEVVKLLARDPFQ